MSNSEFDPDKVERVFEYVLASDYDALLAMYKQAAETMVQTNTQNAQPSGRRFIHQSPIEATADILAHAPGCSKDCDDAGEWLGSGDVTVAPV